MEKSKKFEIILDECLENLLTGTETVEQCLKRYPDQAAELEPLLRTAFAVNNAVAITPGAEVKTRGRYQLQLKMAAIGKPRRAPFLSWQPRWAVAVMSVLLVFTLGGGTVLAADSSMPGNPLYPVKIATENVRIKLAGSDIEKEKILAVCVDRRVGEIAYIAENGTVSPEKAEIIAARYIDHVDRISGLTSTAEQLVATESVNLMSTASAGATTEVPAAAPATPPIQKAVAETTRAQSLESATPQTAVTQDNAEKKSSKSAQEQADKDKDVEQLKNTIISYGISHPKQLEKLLDDPKVPEQSKLAIRRMIQDGKEKYSQTIKNLERQQNEQKDSGKSDKDDETLP